MSRPKFPAGRRDLDPDRLRRVMARSGASVESLAAEVGIGAPTIRSALHYGTTIGSASLKRMALALHVSLDEIVS